MLDSVVRLGFSLLGGKSITWLQCFHQRVRILGGGRKGGKSGRENALVWCGAALAWGSAHEAA